MIDAIVFDVDDTIYDQQEPFRRAILQEFPFFDVQHMNKAYIDYRHYSDIGFPKVVAGEWTIDYFRYMRTNETLIGLGYDEISEEVGARFQKVYEKELENIVMLDEMRLTLEFLKEKNVPVGVITNGPTEHQLKKVKQLGLYAYVLPKNVLVSQATGFQKPQKEIFNLAASQFGMNPDTTLYVGDSYDNDIMGAHNGGWKSLWFNHRGRSLKEGITPVFDCEIDSFEQLFGAVKILFDLPENKIIMDVNDTTNPIFELGLKAGVNICAEKLLTRGIPFCEVCEMLELDKKEIKLLKMKGYA